MKIRKAELKDIPQIQKVRNSVTENVLSDPNLVTDKDCEDFLMNIGFSIVDLQDNNIWALFLLPEFENRGIGKLLQGYQTT